MIGGKGATGALTFPYRWRGAKVHLRAGRGALATAASSYWQAILVIARICRSCCGDFGRVRLPRSLKVPPTMSRLCWAPYEGEECPTCKAEREQAKGVIEERLLQDREEREQLIKDVEDWLDEQG